MTRVFAAAALALLALASIASAAPLTGTLNIPGSYATLAAAITDLNAQGVGAGGVTLNLVASNPQTAPTGGYVVGGGGSVVLTTSSASNPIVIQGNGNVITASGALTAGALNDAIFKLVGADWVTLTGFTMQENAANTTTAAATNNMTEFCVALFYVSLTDGAQNNTIQGNTISLNRTYLNTFGVYSNTRHSSTSMTTTAEVTSAAGSNSNNKVYGNAISNVNFGIVFIGAGTTIAAIDTGNDIGGSSAATGNTITNWGGGAAASAYTSLTGNNYCIFDNQQINDNVSYNTITSAALTSAVTEGGILKNYSVGQPTGTITTTINNNTVTVTDNPTVVAGAVVAINNQGLTTLLATATMSINNNTIQNCVLGGSTVTTGSITGISNLSLPGTLNITGNSVLAHAITATTSTTGIVNGISNSGAAGTVNINSNIVRGLASTATSGQPQGITNSGAVVTALNINNNQLGNASGGFFSTSTLTTGSLFGVSTSAGATTCALSIQSNDIRGITYGSAVSAVQTFFQNTAATLSQNISSNTFTNLNVNTTGSVTFIANAPSLTATGSMAINSNSIVTGFNKGGAGGTVTVFTSNASSVTGSTTSMTGNNFSNITLTGATNFVGINNTDGLSASSGPVKTITGNTLSNISGGTGTMNPMTIDFSGANSTVGTNTISGISWGAAVTGLTLGSSNQATLAVSGNTVSTLSTTAGAVTGITNAAPTANLSGNMVSGLSSTAAVAVTGVANTAGTTVNLLKNKIYDLSGSNASTTVNGLLLSGGTTVTATNNLIGDLRATTASAADVIRGISVTSATAATTYNVYDNTIYLSATSSGANFGTSGIFHTTSATATTAALNLRNNIVTNTSTPNGTGLAVAYRRSSTTLTNFAASSDRNLYHAGTPGASRLIFYDGTNSDQTLAAYKSRVSTRDAGAITENPPFLSTTGSSGSFLHINPATPTQIESNGTAIAGVTDDFDGDTRNVSTPDIGADEGTFTLLDVIVPTITYTPLGGALAGTRTLTATVTDASGVPTSGAGLPVLYWKVNAGAYTGATATSLGSNQYQFSFGGSAVGGDVVSYYVAAQDAAPTPNVAVSPSAGASGLTASPPAASTPPTTPSSFTVTSTISGSFTVGTGGNYTTLTAAVADLNAKVMNGAVTFVLKDPTYAAETFPIVINANSGASATNTVTIKPTTASSAAISGSNASALIELNGADWVTIDGSNNGSSSRNLTLTNTNTGTASAVVWVNSASASDGATNNVVKNCILTGNGATTTFAAIFSGGAIGTASIKTEAQVQGPKGGDLDFGALAAAVANSNNTYQNDAITNAQHGIYSVGVSAAAKNAGTVITQNAITSGIGKAGVLVRFENGVQVTQNTIAGVTSAVSANDVFGISLGLTNVTTTTFTGDEVTNAVVSRNSIGSVTHTATYSAIGIGLAPATSGTTRIDDNMISGVLANATTGDFDAGIFLGGGAGSTAQVYDNSVAMSGTQTGGNYPTFGLAVGGGTPVVDLKNNVLANTQSTGSGKNYAIGLGYSSTAGNYTNLTSTNNDLYVAAGASFATGVTGALNAGTDRATLAAWNAETGRDVPGVSLAGNPLLTSATDLHVATNGALSPLANTGTPVAGLTVDYDGDTRSGSTPDMGADEFTTYTLSLSATNGTATAAPVQPSYNPGQAVLLTATPSTGYHFVNWTGDASGSSDTTTVIMGANRSATANFAINTYTLTAGATAGGSIAPNGATVVNYGANQAFTFSANTGYHVDSLYVDGVSVAPTSPYTFTNVTANHTIQATFAINAFTITASAGANGSIAPSGATSVNYGASQAFTLTPNSGYRVDSLYVDEVSATPASPYTFSNVTANHTIRATFVLDAYTITATAGAHGSITPSGATSVGAGANQAFSFAGDPNWHVDSLVVDGISVATNSPYTFNNVQTNHTIRATFAIDTYTIAASAGANGSIAPSGATTVNAGANQAFTLTPNSSYHLDSLVVDGVSVTPASPYTFTNVTANHTIRATFVLDTYTITATAGAHGSITPSGATSVGAGANQAFSFAGDMNWHVDSLVVDGVSVAPSSPYTFSNVQTNHTIRATFAIDTYTITASAGAHGSITPNGATSVTAGGTQAITFSASANWHVDSLYVDGVSVTPSSPYTFSNVLANHSISVTFAIDTYTITAGAGAHGSITPNGATSVGAEGTQAFAFSAAPNWHVDSLYVDGVSATPSSPYTFTNVLANHTIQVTFAINVYTLTASAGAHGSIAPNGVTNVNAGGSQAYTIAAVAQYHVDDVLVDGVSVGRVAAYTFSNVTASHTIAASFAANPAVPAIGSLATMETVTGNDNDGTVKILVTWTPVAAGSTVQVYHAGYGNYPEYDDAPNAGFVPALPSYPPSAPWVLTSVTGSGQTDEPATRDVYYFVAFVTDSFGTVSAVSNLSNGSLNYHLGDVTNNTTPGQGDNQVNIYDVSLLGAHYGLSGVALAPFAYLDVGPTSTRKSDGRPRTDDVLDFEDLVIFAINYNTVSAPQSASHPVHVAAVTDEMRLTVPGTFTEQGTLTARLDWQGTGAVQALSAKLSWDPAVVRIASSAPGELSDDLGALLLSSRPGVIDIARMGAQGGGLMGEGLLANVTFVRVGPGDPRIELASVDARDAANGHVAVPFRNVSTPLIPAVTSFSRIAPNPFRSNAALSFGLAKGGAVDLAVYSVDGRLVRRLVRGTREAGMYQVAWDGRDDDGSQVSAGVYYARLVTPQGRFNRSLVYLK